MKIMIERITPAVENFFESIEGYIAYVGSTELNLIHAQENLPVQELVNRITVIYTIFSIDPTFAFTKEELQKLLAAMDDFARYYSIQKDLQFQSLLELAQNFRTKAGVSSIPQEVPELVTE